MQSETDALTTLYGTLIDSRDGYEQAAELIESPTLKSLFEEMHDRRVRNAAEVRDFLAAADVDLDDDGSILAAAHRQYLVLKDMISNEDEEVVEEVIRGERQLLEAYDDAIKPMTAGSPAYAFCVEQHASLKTRIDEFEVIEERLDASDD